MRKYRNKKVSRIVNGEVYLFDSKKEARRYDYLLARLRAGVIENLTLQPEFEIVPRVYDEVTKRHLPARKYIADFKYIENGKTIVEDVKSEATRKDKTYRLKRQLFLHRYGKEYNFREV